MRRFTFLILSVSVLMVFTANAQIVLEPKITGSVGYYYFYRNWGTWGGFSHGEVYSSTHLSGGGVAVGGIGTRTTGQNDQGWWRRVYMSYLHGIIEIDLDHTAAGGAFPPPSMTENNWSAFLTGLTMTSGPATGEYMPVDFSDLRDSYEDGAINYWEYYGASQHIESLFQNAPAIGTQFSVDVTEALRRDLFGEGAGDITSGFILTHGYDEWLVRFNSDNPRIRIFIESYPTATPSPAPTQTPVPSPGVDLFLNNTHYTGGDTFKLRAFCTGAPGMADTDLYVLLDVRGEYWFWPGWTPDISYQRIRLTPNETTPVFVLDFIWPEGDYGSMDGLFFHGALMQPGTFHLIGTLDSVSFGFG